MIAQGAADKAEEEKVVVDRDAVAKGADVLMVIVPPLPIRINCSIDSMRTKMVN